MDAERLEAIVRSNFRAENYGCKNASTKGELKAVSFTQDERVVSSHVLLSRDYRQKKLWWDCADSADFIQKNAGGKILQTVDPFRIYYGRVNGVTHYGHYVCKLDEKTAIDATPFSEFSGKVPIGKICENVTLGAMSLSSGYLPYSFEKNKTHAYHSLITIKIAPEKTIDADYLGILIEDNTPVQAKLLRYTEIENGPAILGGTFDIRVHQNQNSFFERLKKVDEEREELREFVDDEVDSFISFVNRTRDKMVTVDFETYMLQGGLG